MSDQGFDFGDEGNASISRDQAVADPNMFFDHNDGELNNQQLFEAQNKAHEENKERFGGSDPFNEHNRIGGNMVPIKDENKPPYTPFYLMVTGHVQSGTFEYSDGICCSFDIVSLKKEW